MRSRWMVAAALLALAFSARAEQSDLGGQARVALRKAVEFYRTKVAAHGGYHFRYTADLSYGRSEHTETPHRVEVQREGTPIVGMAYLDAYEATGDRYYLEAAQDVANLLVRGQLCSGGWDYFIEFDPGKRGQFGYRADRECNGPLAAEAKGVTNLDDNVTQACLRLLMRVDRDLEFKDAKIHEAARFALDSLIKAQYANGAWPQRYSRFPDPKGFPVKRASYPESWPRDWPGSNYYSHYTFNDNSIVDAIDALLEAARVYNEPRYRAAAERGGDFILLAQMPEPQPGWAQQYDRDMHPAWARRFEPPSVTGGESQSVMKMLVVLYRETGNRKYLEPLPRALAYYKRSILPEVENPSEIRRRACPEGTACLARFYELRTNRPLYITKGTRVSVLDQSATTVDGYEVSYSDASVITHYGVLTSGERLKQIEREYQEIVHADPATLRRPDRLHGLSPWSGREAPIGSGVREGAEAPGGLQERARAVIAALDARGASVEKGTIGKADRIVSVFASRDMVVSLAGKAYPMKENDTLDIYPGGEPPRQRIIVSQTFARNIGLLSRYLAR
ncbi:MAG: polysaccharide lyase [Acidobacteria bacterium]|nr:MAG: polysaccharide lyase [Acidobacteriota bacterium]